MSRDYLESTHGRVAVASILVLVIVFPVVFLGDYDGTIRRTFLIATLVGGLLTWAAILLWTSPQPGGGRGASAATSLPVAAVAVLLIVLLPIQFLAAVGGLAEGFFLVCAATWLVDLYRLEGWRRD